MKRPTIHDIAAAVGVSTAAVSFALNGKPGVSPATRQEILDAAKELGWAPNTAARALSTRKARAAGMVITRPKDSYASERFFFDFITGMQGVLSELRIDLVLATARTLADEMDIYTRWWRHGTVDGVFVLDPREEDSRPKLLKELSIPAVVIGKKVEGLGAVLASDADMMTILATHLVSRGATHIGFVSGLESLMHTKARQDAVVEFARSAGVSVSVSCGSDQTESSGYSETLNLLEHTGVKCSFGSGVPDAIIYDNEVLALGGLMALRDRGMKVGRDILIASCEDSEICRFTKPQITAISRDPAIMGEHAARVLSGLVRQTGEPPVQVETLEIVERDSSKGLRGKTAQGR